MGGYNAQNAATRTAAASIGLHKSAKVTTPYFFLK